MRNAHGLYSANGLGNLYNKHRTCSPFSFVDEIVIDAVDHKAALEK